MIIKETFIVQVTPQNCEKFRTLRAAHNRSADLVHAGIPHDIVVEITDVYTRVLNRVEA